MSYLDIDLVPMSMEELKMRGWANSRANGIKQLWYVDGLGNTYLLLGDEHEKAGMSKEWPEYMKHNYGIKYINKKRRTKRTME